MGSLFNVVFTGELKPGTERETVIKAFSEHFKCDEDKARTLLSNGSAVTMKSAVPKDVAENYRDALEALGMTAMLEPLDPNNTAQPSTVTNNASTPGSTNPYEAPGANLNTVQKDGEMTGPVSVPAGHGLRWIGSAFNNHFRANPGEWIVAVVVLFALSIVMQFVPLIGPIAMSLLSAVFTGGLMLGARAQDQGEDFTVGHLFAGFKQSTGQLVLLGAIYMVGSLVIGIITVVIMFGSMSTMNPNSDLAAIDAIMQNPMAATLPILIAAALFMPFLMAYWFAPALVALDGMTALTAMRMSFVACLKNIMPFLLYGIVMLVLAVIASLPLMLGFLVLLPVIMASIYTGYRDIYYPKDE